MGLKVATNCMQWSQSTIVPHSPPPPPQTLTYFVSSHLKKQSRSDRALVCLYVQSLDRSTLFGTSSSSTKLYRSRSCEYPDSGVQSLRRASSTSFDASSCSDDDEFAKKIQELALKFQLSGEDDDIRKTTEDAESELVTDFSRDKQGENRGGGGSCNGFNDSSLKTNGLNFSSVHGQGPFKTIVHRVEPPWLGIRNEPPDWPGADEIIPASIDRKANSVDLPLSLRIIKRKKQWQEDFKEAGKSAYCSIKKAFSSMVFIIWEIHSYTLQMREILFYEDLQGILARVQQEMHASFVWLFQKVFSHTPTLMVSVMILLANFTVYSMATNGPIAVSLPSGTCTTVSLIETLEQRPEKLDSSAIKTFTVSSSGGKVTSVGGNSGGGGKVRPIGSGTDGDGRFESTEHYRTMLPDGASQVSSVGREGSTSEEVAREEELNVWNSIVEEASKMHSTLRDEALDHETKQGLVSPVTAKVESDDFVVYFRTELLYRTALAQDPNNPLLLANFAQFLCLVAHDYDRAEQYFKRAVEVEPADAEALSKYASFLWVVKKDLWAAEETYLEAISADPTNSFYAANYAHFLWSTGGEDTCFPLNATPDTEDDTHFA